MILIFVIAIVQLFLCDSTEYSIENENELESAVYPENEVLLYLYTRANPDNGQLLANVESVILNSHFKSDKSTKFVIYGTQNYLSSVPINVDIKKAYLQRDECNVIVVEWIRDISYELDYVLMRQSIHHVSVKLADFMNFLVDKNFLTLETTTMVGHSLGAHIVGITSKKLLSGKVKSIYGLDPTGFLFDTHNTQERFHSTDASYTEAIHTNIGCIGYTQPMALVDFYPNYGEHQPGCNTKCHFNGFEFKAEDVSTSCCHNRAIELFIESINSTAFYATKCADGFDDIQQEECQPSNEFAIMGDHPDKSFDANGVFFLKTNVKFPYARGKSVSCSCAYI